MICKIFCPTCQSILSIETTGKPIITCLSCGFRVRFPKEIWGDILLRFSINQLQLPFTYTEKIIK
jgi:hypothetical protein